MNERNHVISSFSQSGMPVILSVIKKGSPPHKLSIVKSSELASIYNAKFKELNDAYKKLISL